MDGYANRSYARKKIKRIKKALNKQDQHMLTIKENYEYYAFDINEVTTLLDKFERK